jgi:hypothetical protein
VIQHTVSLQMQISDAFKEPSKVGRRETISIARCTELRTLTSRLPSSIHYGRLGFGPLWPLRFFGKG